MFLLYLFIIIIFVNVSNCLMCVDLLTLNETRDEKILSQTLDDDLKLCLTKIGHSPINAKQSKIIWNYVKYQCKKIDNIPTDYFYNMGWILNGIDPDDFQYIKIDNIEMIEVLGRYHGLSLQQLSAIADQVRVNWGNKNTEDYSEYDLITLRQILCGFNRSEIENIHPDAYKPAAGVIGLLRDCPQEILEAFAYLAVQETAFDSPKLWTKLDVSTIGIVVSGLSASDYAMIPADYLKMFKNIKQ